METKYLTSRIVPPKGIFMNFCFFRWVCFEENSRRWYSWGLEPSTGNCYGAVGTWAIFRKLFWDLKTGRRISDFRLNRICVLGAVCIQWTRFIRYLYCKMFLSTGGTLLERFGSSAALGKSLNPLACMHVTDRDLPNGFSWGLILEKLTKLCSYFSFRVHRPFLTTTLHGELHACISARIWCLNSLIIFV